jgi:hypothetical protein
VPAGAAACLSAGGKPPAAGPRHSPDPCLCAAIVDRLTFNGAIIDTGTDSYRLGHAGAQQPAPVEGPEHRDSCSFSLKAAGWFICPK